MNTRKKVSLDRLLGIPLVMVLNISARIIAFVIRRDHNISTECVRTIVVAKYAGMGSIIQAIPLLRSIRTRFPNSRIIFATSSSCEDLVHRIDHVDEVIAVDDHNLWLGATSSVAAIARLVASRVDLYFDLEVYSAYAASISLMSMARNRFGFYRESTVHKKGIYTHLMYFNTRAPIREIYLQLGLAAGCRRDVTDSFDSIRIREEDRNEISHLKFEPREYIVVNPNASDLMVERRWPLTNFSDFVRIISKILPVVLIGADSDVSYVSMINVPGVLNLAGKLSLGGLLALLEKAKCLVTNDTGPMHMAQALGTPTVCLFGPVDPAHYGRSAPGIEILYHRIYCSPCLHEVDEPPCHGNNVCMQRITVEEVLAATNRILNDQVTSPLSGEGQHFFTDDNDVPLGRIVRGSLEHSAQ